MSNGFAYQIDTAPVWIVPSPQPIATQSRNASDTRTLMNDVQVNLFGQKPAYYVHYQTIALQRSGLEKISQIHIPFNPAYETLTLHDIAVIRNGQRISRLKEAKVELLRREQNLESKLIDGEVTALIVLSDVRLGDAIDVSYSTYGANPAFTDQFTMNFALNRNDDIGALRLRVIYPLARKLNYKMINSTLTPALSKNASGQILQIARENVAAVKQEEDVPQWYDMFEWIHLSEYKDWQDVNQWALKHFSLPDNTGAAVDKIAREIAARYDTPKERTIAALTFVQNEVRYFGIEIGASSHIPKRPEQTLLDRFGDCKDKTQLLVALLRRMGIEAHAALVSARYARGIAERLPSPFSFDHVITQAVVDGTTYWFDPTLRYQGSNIDTLGFASYGKALVVKTDTHDLTEMAFPQNYANQSQYVETFRVDNFNQPIGLTIRQTYHRQFAELMRASLHTNGAEVLQKDLYDRYLRVYPGLTIAKPVQIKDDPERNVVELTGYFDLDDYLKYANGQFRFENVPLNLIDATSLPRQLARRYPLALSFPYQTTHRVELIWPEKITVKHLPSSNRTDQFFSDTSRHEIKDNRMVLEESLRTMQDHVPPQSMGRYAARLKKIRNELGISVKLGIYNTDAVNKRYAEKTRGLSGTDGLEKLLQKQLAVQLIGDDIIASGKLAGKLLAQVYLDRALASNLLGQNKNARADIEMAMKLDPDNIAIGKGYAEILTAGGKFSDALRAIEAVKALDMNQEPFSLRAKNLFMLGKFKDAEDVFSSSIRAASTDEAAQYDVLWLALARMRRGETVGTAVKELATQTGLTEQVWPGQILNAILGTTTVEQALRDAASDQNEARLRRTEALFYLGQLALAKHETKTARDAFQQIISIGATMYWEHSLAKIELERLN